MALCEHCGEEKRRNSVEVIVAEGEIVTKHICQECLNEFYHECTRCGKWVLKEDMHLSNYKCDRCFRLSSKKLYGYHEFNDLKFRKTDLDMEENPLYLGFELELETEEQLDSYEEEVADRASKVKRALGYEVSCSRDGSVDFGFEIVSNPMTLNYIKTNKKLFQEGFKAIKDNKLESTESCGFHVHVSRNFLGADRREQEEVINRMYLIIEYFKEEIVKFSRRSQSAINNYSEFLLADYERKGITYKSIENKDKDNTRYMAINVMNRNTVEFRIFKSMDNFNTFMATLELVDNIVRIAKKRDLEQLKGLTWIQLLSYNKAKYTRDYCKSIGLESRNRLKEFEPNEAKILRCLNKIKREDIKLSREYRKILNKIIKDMGKFVKVINKKYIDGISKARAENYDNVFKNNTIIKFKETREKYISEDLETVMNCVVEIKGALKRIYFMADYNWSNTIKVAPVELINVKSLTSIIKLYNKVQNFINGLPLDFNGENNINYNLTNYNDQELVDGYIRIRSDYYGLGGKEDEQAAS